MRANSFKTVLGRTGFVASILLASAAAFADSSVTLTATPTYTALPDGQVVPMWGYGCGDYATPQVPSVNATCTTLTGGSQTGAWQPPLITMSSGQPLTITLNNKLIFGVNTVSTSLVIDGQLGGGLGAPPTTSDPIQHPAYGPTWPASGDNS